MAISDGLKHRMLPSANQAFRPTSFHSVRPPAISRDEYLHQLSTRFGKYLSDEALLLGVVYVDRVTKMRPELVLNGASMHRHILTSTVVAAKFHDDECYSNV